MKKFSNYQYVGGVPSERDKKEANSKFWNKGKWDNFVLPFLPENCEGMTLVDMGCNAGIFLKLAEDKGFDRVLGVDANKEAVKKGMKYRETVGGKWRFVHIDIRDSLHRIPAADYIIMAMSHYYLPIDHWLKFLNELQTKTRYCIIVTANKREKLCKASAATKDIRGYFKLWKETGFIPELSLDNDPFPRRQWSFCFKSPFIERMDINTLDCGNHVQGGFWQDIDDGKDPFKSRYYRILKQYRLKKNPESPSVWTKEQLIKFINEKTVLYKNIKENGLQEPLIINSNNRILDGNHRHEMLRHLGYKTILVRKA